MVSLIVRSTPWSLFPLFLFRHCLVSFVCVFPSDHPLRGVGEQIVKPPLFKGYLFGFSSVYDDTASKIVT